MKHFISIFAVLVCVVATGILLASCSFSNALGIPNGKYALCDPTGTISIKSTVFKVQGVNIEVTDTVQFLPPYFIGREIKSMKITQTNIISSNRKTVLACTYMKNGSEERETLDIEYDKSTTIVKISFVGGKTFYYKKI